MGLPVFSEIHYPKGFEVTIDGQAVDMLRANYILRALAVPAGNHVIEFKFVPKDLYSRNDCDADFFNLGGTIVLELPSFDL